MKKTIALAIFSSLLSAVASQAASTASDNASNTIYNDGNFSGDNGGTGFGSWSVSTTGSGGSYVGSSGAGTTSIAIYSSSGDSASANRAFTGGALVSGQTFSITIGNSSNINSGGEVGLNLLDGVSTVFTLKMVGGGSAWQLNNGGSDFGSGQNYAANTALTFAFTYNGSNNYSYTFGTGSGTNHTATNTLTNITGFRLYTNKQGSGENFGATSMSVVPEPTAAVLGSIGMLFLLRRGRR